MIRGFYEGRFSMVRIAMLGSGFVCDFYMRALRYVPDHRVVVNFSQTRSKAEDFAKRWGVPNSATDLRLSLIHI